MNHEEVLLTDTKRKRAFLRARARGRRALNGFETLVEAGPAVDATAQVKGGLARVKKGLAHDLEAAKPSLGINRLRLENGLHRLRVMFG